MVAWKWLLSSSFNGSGGTIPPCVSPSYGIQKKGPYTGPFTEEMKNEIVGNQQKVSNPRAVGRRGRIDHTRNTITTTRSRRDRDV
jgi:hypothetical protein